MWWYLFIFSLVCGFVATYFLLSQPKQFAIFTMRNLFIIATYSLLYVVLMFIFNWKLTLALFLISPVIGLACQGLTAYIPKVKEWEDTWFRQYMEGISHVDHSGSTELDWRGAYIKEPTQ